MKTSWIVRVVLAAIVVGGVIWYLKLRGHNETTAATGGDKGAQGAQGDKGDKGDKSAKGGGPSGGGRVVPVQVAPAEKKDYPIWLEGLGSVAAFQQVVIRPQVDGLLSQVKFVEGQSVKKGEVIAQIDPRPFEVLLHTAQGALARDQAQLVAARADLARQKDLHAQNLVAQAMVDASAGTVGNLEGAVKMDQASVESANLQLDYAAVKSPLDGITGVRQVDAGNVVHATDPNGIVVITAIDPAAVLFTLPQDRLPAVAAALAAATPEHPVPVQVWNRDNSIQLGAGSLAVIDNQVNAATSTMRMKAIMPNPKRTLWPNAFVKTKVLVDTRKDAIVIPAAAVQQGPTGSFVYVVGADKTVTMTPVVVGITSADTTIIDKGLAGSESVVTEGANQLRNGGKVDTGGGQGSGDAGGGSGAHGSGDGSGGGGHGHHGKPK